MLDMAGQRSGTSLGLTLATRPRQLARRQATLTRKGADRQRSQADAASSSLGLSFGLASVGWLTASHRGRRAEPKAWRWA